MTLLDLFRAWNLTEVARALIDIGIVAFVLYKALLLVKGTRAVQLLKGLALLGVFSLLSVELEFQTVNWILNKAGLAILVAVPVVFQPELRRALEQLGRGRLLGRPIGLFVNKEEVSDLIEVLADTIDIMVRRRIGALIIIEQETGLKDYMETGVAIDGIVSPEFLLNIFFPNSPLHDGAAIISGTRIAAAACLLPLTDRPFLSKELGTRHRAALGISEDTDAIALVVSEETGIVSIAHEGKITRRLDRKQLEEILVRLMFPEDSRELPNILRPRPRG